jgi:hypothetical protein
MPRISSYNGDTDVRSSAHGSQVPTRDQPREACQARSDDLSDREGARLVARLDVLSGGAPAGAPPAMCPGRLRNNEPDAGPGSGRSQPDPGPAPADRAARSPVPGRQREARCRAGSCRSGDEKPGPGPAPADPAARSPVPGRLLPIRVSLVSAAASRAPAGTVPAAASRALRLGPAGAMRHRGRRQAPVRT